MSKAKHRLARVTALALVLALPVLAGCASLAQLGAMHSAQRSIAKGKYEAALLNLFQAEKYKAPDGELRAEIAFLRGRCHEGLGREAEAIAIYQYTADTFPTTSHGYQAKARIAELQKPPQS
ncbi:MAG: hypothetical protein LBC18_01980 [Opitutaceae bacterium]|nr:hypothetical protein [Opitutaceae bacterium]